MLLYPHACTLVRFHMAIARGRGPGAKGPPQGARVSTSAHRSPIHIAIPTHSFHTPTSQHLPRFCTPTLVRLYASTWPSLEVGALGQKAPQGTRVSTSAHRSPIHIAIPTHSFHTPTSQHLPRFCTPTLVRLYASTWPSLEVGALGPKAPQGASVSTSAHRSPIHVAIPTHSFHTSTSQHLPRFCTPTLLYPRAFTPPHPTTFTWP